MYIDTSKLNKSDTVSISILYGAAKALFASAWADYQDHLFEAGQDHENLSGIEIMDVIPDTIDDAAWATAGMVIAQYHDSVGEAAVKTYQDNAESFDTPELFGHYLAMEAMGHGVGLFDYGVNVDVPRTEFGFYDLDPNTYPTFDGADD